MGFFAEIARFRPRPDATPGRAVWVGFDQLSPRHPLLRGVPPAELPLVYVETGWKPARRAYHPQKLALLLSAQRHHALERAREGHPVVYLFSEQGYDGALAQARERWGFASIEALAPAEREVREPVARLPFVALRENTLFATDAAFYRRVFPRPGRRLLETFYRAARRRTGLLMDGDAPAGGTWNLDALNRKPWKGAPPVPARPRFAPDAVTEEVLALVRERYASGRFGDLAGFDWPVTAAEAERAAEHFFARLLPHFGPYEDAMHADEPALFHSRLSAPLNLGLLDPLDLCRRAEAGYRLGHAPLASAEGFVRQVLGWREFVRHVFEETPDYHERNALQAELPLPAWYWGAASGLRCLDLTVAQVKARAHSHHITRLMVLANVATLLGVDPRALNEWFWVAYADAYEWVVTPNVVGMGTFADGGLFATKPYVASGRYVHKMGASLCAGCRFDPRRSDGEGACPLNHLYWDFFARHHERFARNVRLAMPLRQLAKMPAEVLADHRAQAEAWRERARSAALS
ncbi:MAG: cryptochrome/photolyase family protein [Vicinamibacteria bacterium]|nr:cryptochrome/photolyase family protein [Vicinamibacteria bacterium]